MESVPPIWVPGMAIEDGMFTNRSTGNCDQHPWRVLSRRLCSSQPRTCWRAVLKSWRNLRPKKLAIKFPKLMATSQSLQHSALHQWVYQSLSLKPRYLSSLFSWFPIFLQSPGPNCPIGPMKLRFHCIKALFITSAWNRPPEGVSSSSQPKTSTWGDPEEKQTKSACRF